MLGAPGQPASEGDPLFLCVESEAPLYGRPALALSESFNNSERAQTVCSRIWGEKKWEGIVIALCCLLVTVLRCSGYGTLCKLSVMALVGLIGY